MDYFYGEESEQFAFYQIPKILMTNNRYKEMSDSAKILFGLMLSRMSLSRKNQWLDEECRVYIIYSVEDAMADMNCGNKKVIKLMKELESFRLIFRKRQGQGKPSIIYPLDFAKTDKTDEENAENTANSQKCQNDTSRSVKGTSQEVSKGHTNYIDNNYTENSYIQIASLQKRPEKKRPEKNRTKKEINRPNREDVRETIETNIDYTALLDEFPSETDRLEEILEIIVDTVCTVKPTIRISGDDKDTEEVKVKFLHLKIDHIRYVLTGLDESSTLIRNPKQYLIAALYNSLFTITNSYRNKAQCRLGF